MTNILMAAAALLLAAVTLHPRLLRSDRWRATVTPLASIIGSGFLVAGPILGYALGRWAVAGMIALCALSYMFGEAIRDNIRRVEPLIEGQPPAAVSVLEHLSNLALILAYFVSVAYYLYLFSAFALKGFGIVDQEAARAITTAVVAALGVVGLFGGLRWLEHVELGAVGLKLALIGALCVGLAWAVGADVAGGVLPQPASPAVGGVASIRILLGLVILVQGFETSRYLGEHYDAELRVATMRRAQLLAFAIYIAFIALLTPFLDGKLPPDGGETHIVTLIGGVAMLIAPFIIVAALMSQLSAAVADMNGASGLVRSASGGRIGAKLGYVATAAAAVAITWAADIFQIIVYASKAFVLYYGLQAITAGVIEARHRERRQTGRLILFGAATLVAVAVLVLGKAA